MRSGTWKHPGCVFAIVALCTAAGAADDGARAAVPQAANPRAAASSGFADESDRSLPWRASAEDCRLWRQEYRHSEACFAPFRTARGGIKPEAFSVCGPELLDPEFECGGRR